MFYQMDKQSFSSSSPYSDMDTLSQYSTSGLISCLFPEILTNIFKYLNVKDLGRVCQVCVLWRDAAYNRRVWKDVEAHLHLHRSNPYLFPSLVRRGIKRIQILSFKKNLRDLIKDGLPTIESLNLSGCYNLTDATLGQALTQEISTLTVLDLSLCKQITDSTLGRTASYLINLESLDLSGCSNITCNGILLIAFGLKKLRYLYLRSLRNLTDEAVDHLAGIKSCHSLPYLERLSLKDCRLTNAGLKSISIGLTNLKSLDISFCYNLTDTGLSFLAQMPNLQELNLCMCINIGDCGISFLANGTCRLTSLNVAFCDRITDQGLISVSQGLTCLRILNLSALPITDFGLSIITQSLSNLKQFYLGQCTFLTDKCIENIVENLTFLEYIDLYGCYHLSSGSIEKLKYIAALQKANLEIHS